MPRAFHPAFMYVMSRITKKAKIASWVSCLIHTNGSQICIHVFLTGHIQNNDVKHKINDYVVHNMPTTNNMHRGRSYYWWIKN